MPALLPEGDVSRSPFSFSYEELAMRKTLVKVVKRFVREEDAPTAVEYGLMVALIAVVVIAGATALGTSTLGVFNAVAAAI